MSARVLDLTVLRTFVVAHDLGGLGQAANRLGRTPSAISLQMNRLQEDIGVPLFRKEGRGLALTEAGHVVLRYARRLLATQDELLDTVRGAALAGAVRIGVSQDFADTVLPPTLSRFAQFFPLVVVELRIDGNAALVEALHEGALDLVLVVGHAEQPSAQVVGQLDLEWIAAPGFVAALDQPLPLLLLGPQCVFRRLAIEHLDRAQRRWRLAAVSPSLSGIWASAIGGLGVTLRTRLGVPAALETGRTLLGLPVVPALPVTVHEGHAPSAAVSRLREFLVEEVRRVL